MPIKVVENRSVAGKGEEEEERPDLIRPGHLDEDIYERSKRLGWFDIDAIEGSKVLMVGAGAIGNEVLKNLILTGFKHITIVDMDHVVKSNLNRCLFFDLGDADEKSYKAEIVARKASQMAPGLDIKHHVSRIEELGDEFIPSFDLVFGCLDNLAARLHLNAHCYYSSTPYIDGATLGMTGKVQVVIGPKTPCVECTLNRTHIETVEKRYSCTGTDMNFVEPKLAAEITTTSVISAVEVREGIKIACDLHDKVLKGIFYYHGIRNETMIMDIEINPNCPHHFMAQEEG